MKGFKKVLALIMSAVTAFSLLAGGCGGNEVDENFKDNDEFYTINWYMPINTTTTPQDMGKVQQKVNEYLKDKLNAAVNIKSYSFTEYSGKLGTKVANAEEFDLLWTDFESYERYLEMDALYPLDELIKEYGKDVYSKFREEFWEQTRYSDGKLYAVINNQILPRTFGIEVRDSDYYKEYVLSTASTVLNQATGVNADDVYAVQDYIADNFTFAQKLDYLENYMAWLRNNKSGENESCGGITWGMEILYVLESLGFDALGSSMSVPGVVRADADGKPVVINQFETEEFKLLVNKFAEWYSKGYIPKDVQSGNYTSTTTDFSSSRTWTPDYKVKFSAGGKSRTREVFRFGKSYYVESYINGTMWSISRTSANPARTMKFINLMHTDSYLHNLLKLGIEGEHYVVNENGQAEITSKSIRYHLEGVRWIFGDETIGITLSTQAKGVYDQVKKINQETPLSSVIGFKFDRTSVVTDIQLSSGVVTEFISNLGCGEQLYKKSDYYDEFIKKLKDNGADKVIAEKQRQLDLWWAKKQA